MTECYICFTTHFIKFGK